jgi:hypothetical protein
MFLLLVSTSNCFIKLSYGTSVGWISPALQLLKSKNSPLPTGALTIDEIAVIGGASCVGGFAASCIYGWVK